jgi:hypothetical protein
MRKLTLNSPRILRGIVANIVVITLLFTQPCQSHAFVIPLLFATGAAAAVKLAGGALLGEAEDRATRVVKEFERTGDSLLGHASNQMELILKQLRKMSRDERDAAFAQLSDAKKQLFIEFNNILISLGEDILPALNWKAELRTYDLMRAIQSGNPLSPVYNEDTVLFGSVYGSIVPKDPNGIGPYVFQVSGFGLGSNSKGLSQVIVKLNQKELPEEALDRSENNAVTVKIPARLLDPLFLKNRAWSASVELACTPKGTKKVSRLDFKLILLPIEAAHIRVTHKVREFSWTKQPPKSVLFSRLNGAGGGAGDYFEMKWICGEDERIDHVEYPPITKPAELAGFSYHTDPKQGYALDVVITKDQREVHIARRLGSWPMHVEHKIIYEKKVAVDKEEIIGEYVLCYNDPVIIYLDASHNPDGNFMITGTNFEGKRLLLTSEMALRPDNPLRLEGFGLAGQNRRMILQLVPRPK